MLKVLLYFISKTVLELNFRDKPNYEYVRGLFREMAIKNKILFDF